MTNTGIEQMVMQLRAVAAQAAQASPAQAAPGEDFSTLLKNAINATNDAQQEAKDLTKQFETGNPNVDLQDVVMSLQKASISFQTMVQVRNKLVSAYQEIMNMQV
jgi:flagellar hook-basal body complex protein FliE